MPEGKGNAHLLPNDVTGRRRPQELQEELERRTGGSILLFLNDNRRRMISVWRRGVDVLEVRLQRAFLAAPPEVLDELAKMVAGEPADRAVLRTFVAEYFQDGDTHVPVPRTPRTSSSRSGDRGCHHDIAQYARELNALYLNGRSTARVQWGRRGQKRSTRSIRFACYDLSRNLVIMNRKLDSPDIPRYFVEFVLFHEMLHEVLGIGEKADGRRDIHGRVFKLMETTYPDYDKALRFEKDLLTRLESL